jgi:hypothetical protein
MAQAGDLAGALVLIDESIAQIEQPGWEERHYYAEALRIGALLLTLKSDAEGAERAYIASLDWARKQLAKSWELRTATSYARLMRERGREREARELLAPGPISEWLEKLGLGQYAQRFAENGIDFSVVGYLTDQDLEKVGAKPASAPIAANIFRRCRAGRALATLP